MGSNEVFYDSSRECIASLQSPGPQSLSGRRSEKDERKKRGFGDGGCLSPFFEIKFFFVTL